MKKRTTRRGQPSFELIINNYKCIYNKGIYNFCIFAPKQ